MHGFDRLRLLNCKGFFIRKNGVFDLHLVYKSLICYFMFFPLYLFHLTCEEGPPLIPREILFGNPEKAMPHISPNGQFLTWLAPNEKKVLNIWIAPLGQIDKSFQVTSDDKRGIRFYLWQYDNEHLIYAQDQDGDENWHLYQTNITTRETKDLTPFPNVRATILAYHPTHPEEMLVLLNKRDLSLFDVYRLNLKTGTLTLDTENFDQVIYWAANSDLIVQAALSYTADEEILIRSRESKDQLWKELLRWKAVEDFENSMFIGPNSTLYLLTSLDGETVRVLNIDLKTGRRKIIAEDPLYDISEIMIEPFSRQIEAVGIEREKGEWIILDSSIKDDFDKIGQATRGNFNILSRDLSKRLWIVAVESDIHPTAYYLYDRTAQNMQFLFSSKPALDKYDLSPMTPVSFTARDGMRLHGYLTQPLTKEKKTFPAILLVQEIHGVIMPRFNG